MNNHILSIDLNVCLGYILSENEIHVLDHVNVI